MAPFACDLLIALVFIEALMCLLWIVSTLRGDASIVDPFWGMGFVAVSWLAAYRNWPLAPRSVLLLGLITAWGCRLSLFLLIRNWGHPEDRRYAAMRQRRGERFWWLSLFTVFLLQGVILWFIALPIQAVVSLNERSALPYSTSRAQSCGQLAFCSNQSAIGSWPDSKPIRPTKDGSCSVACGNTPGIPTTSATLARGGECS